MRQSKIANKLLAERHPIWLTVTLHFLPGLIIVVAYLLLAAPLAKSLGLSPFIGWVIAMCMALLPTEFGLLLWLGYQRNNLKQYVIELSDTTDTIVIGRKLAVDYIPYWENVSTKPDDPFYEVAQRIVRARKVVFTKTLDKSEWANTDLAKGNLVEEIEQIKSKNKKDIIVYGGSSFVSSLIKEKLIDEFHLFVNPVALGKGVPIFSELGEFQHLELKKSITYHSGLVLLNYELI